MDFDPEGDTDPEIYLNAADMLSFCHPSRVPGGLGDIRYPRFPEPSARDHLGLKPSAPPGLMPAACGGVDLNALSMS